MPPHRLLMLRRFFQDYKQLEGKAVEVDEIRPPAEAYPIILDALHRYSEQRRKGFKAAKPKFFSLVATSDRRPPPCPGRVRGSAIWIPIF